MRNDKIVPGVVLIIIGALILLHNYDLLDFHWLNFVYLIPIMIVVWGVNLIFGANKSSPVAVGIKIGIIAIGFALVLFGDFAKRHSFWNNDYTFNIDGDDDDDNDHPGSVTRVEGNSEYNTPYGDSVKIARLHISGGGAVYTLEDTTEQLFNASTREFKGKYIYSHSQQDSIADLSFKMDGRNGIKFNFKDDHGRKARNNEAIFKLNTKPEWEMNIKAGAVKLDFDLSKFKIRSLDLAGGAAEFNVKLGQPLANTNVSIETGMSDVNVSVPTGAACRIKSSTGLSSTNFEGFTKVSDNTYETPGFAKATNKLYIKISGGMADFKVERY